MIEHVSSSDAFLYHYTKATTALDYIFKNRELRFGSYASTNDPKESKAWEFDLGTNENRDLGKYKMSEVSSWLSAELKQRTNLVCFSMDTAPLTGDHLTDIFKRAFSKPRMWSQYADRHTGVCIVFDWKKLAGLIQSQFGSADLVLAGPVSYIDRSVVRDLSAHEYMINVDAMEILGREAYVQTHLRAHYKSLFFEKMIDWRDEVEWRWVVFSDREGDLYLDVRDSVAGLIFGENTEEKVVQDLMDLTEGWGLRYMGLKWKNSSPWYDYGNLRYVQGIKNSGWGTLVRRV